MRQLNVETPIHGRVLIEDAAVSVSRGWLIGFHGYGQSAEDIFTELQRLNPDRGWSIAAPQGLHRFYTRRDERVVASWMTRQDRDLAIADNVEYCNRLLTLLPGSHLELQHPETGVAAPLVFVGFSQGVAMAYRAAALGRFPVRLVVALAGDMPPEVRTADPATVRRQIGRVLIGAGVHDDWFTPAKAEADAAALAAAGVLHDVVRFDGGHEWHDDVRAAVRDALAALA